MKHQEKHILETVHGLTDEIMDLTSRLVAEPSTLGNEGSVLRVMEEQLTSLGFSPVRVPIDTSDLEQHPGYAPVPWSYEGRYNVVATREADGEGGKSALFNGHLDVVSPEPASLWESGPFNPVIRDGWLYGRGAGDMKAGVAAMTYAVHAVEKAGFGLKAPVTVEGVIEEECSGNGALACMAAGYDADAVLIPEPFGPTILTNQVGVLWFRVAVRGRSTHVLDTSAGANAIEKCILLINALKSLEQELNEENVPPPYEDVQHPLNLNIGVIHGGDWPSNVPGAAEFRARLSFFPGMSYKEIKERVADTIRQQAQNDPWMKQYPPEVDFYGFRSEGHSVSRSQPALAALNDCHKIVTGEDAVEYIATCTSDLRVFHFYGRGQATCYGPVAENIHGADEKVNMESVTHTAKVYALFLARWCGLTQ